MLRYRDFAPGTLNGKWYQKESYESFDAAVEAANEWLDAEPLDVVNVETVVLPNMNADGEEGTRDASLDIASGWASWHQFLRVWYREAA